jgi:hypothetical protein
MVRLFELGSILFPLILQERRWDLTIPDVSVFFNGNSKKEGLE